MKSDLSAQGLSSSPHWLSLDVYPAASPAAAAAAVAMVIHPDPVCSAVPPPRSLPLSLSLSILRCLLYVSLPSFSLSWRGFQFGESARTVSRNLPLRLSPPRPPDPRSADNGAQTACSFIKGGGDINGQQRSGVCVRAHAYVCPTAALLCVRPAELASWRQSLPPKSRSEPCSRILP